MIILLKMNLGELQNIWKYHVNGEAKCIGKINSYSVCRLSSNLSKVASTVLDASKTSSRPGMRKRFRMQFLGAKWISRF